MRCSNGDLRKAITKLQALHQIDMPITIDLVKSMEGFIPDKVFDTVLSLCKNADYLKISNFLKNSIFQKGYSAMQFIRQLSDNLLHTALHLNEKKLPILLMRIADIELSLSKGTDEFVVLQEVTACVCDALNN